MGKHQLHHRPLGEADVPDPSDNAFEVLLDDYFTQGLLLIQTLSLQLTQRSWNDRGTKDKGRIRVLDLPDKAAFVPIREQLGLTGDYWCARSSVHSLAGTEHGDQGSGQGQESLYDMFKQGLLVDHSKHEQEYIKSCTAADRLRVYRSGQAEVWRMAYHTPAPSSDRTFVILFLCRELPDDDAGGRSFLNVTLPFDHPACPEKQGAESRRVRGKYVSVEHVQEEPDGRVVWSMATSSDAGGSIPQWITNAALPGAISEDVPSFLGWLEKRHGMEAGSIQTALPRAASA